MGRRGDLLLAFRRPDFALLTNRSIRERSTDEQPSTSESGLSIESLPTAETSFSTGTPGLVGSLMSAESA